MSKLKAIELVPALRCPGCQTICLPLDGSDWGLNREGGFKIKCACGRVVTGTISVAVEFDSNDEAERQEQQRIAAEKNRRGIELLQKKSAEVGAKVCTTDGRPPDPDYAEIGNAPRPIKDNGQHESYYVLCEEERAKGFVRPVRDRYRHKKCGTFTTMGRALSETYARDPHFYGATMCCACGTHFPLVDSSTATEFASSCGSASTGTTQKVSESSYERIRRSAGRTGAAQRARHPPYAGGG
jgi:hypothetical protein